MIDLNSFGDLRNSCRCEQLFGGCAPAQDADFDRQSAHCRTEDQLGVRLLERSTRNLRLTDVGSEVLEQARRSVEISEAIDNVVSNRLSNISACCGFLHRRASLTCFSHWSVHSMRPIQTFASRFFVTDRYVDHIAEGSTWCSGSAPEPNGFLPCREEHHDLSASAAGEPAYLEKSKPPEKRRTCSPPPSRLCVLQGREQLVVYHVNGKDKETLSFVPTFR